MPPFQPTHQKGDARPPGGQATAVLGTLWLIQSHRDSAGDVAECPPEGAVGHCPARFALDSGRKWHARVCQGSFRFGRSREWSESTLLTRGLWVAPNTRDACVTCPLPVSFRRRKACRRVQRDATFFPRTFEDAGRQGAARSVRQACKEERPCATRSVESRSTSERPFKPM